MRCGRRRFFRRDDEEEEEDDDDDEVAVVWRPAVGAPDSGVGLRASSAADTGVERVDNRHVKKHNSRQSVDGGIAVATRSRRFGTCDGRAATVFWLLLWLLQRGGDNSTFPIVDRRLIFIVVGVVVVGAEETG